MSRFHTSRIVPLAVLALAARVRVNDLGQVAGVCGNNPGLHGCLDSNGTMTDLGNNFSPAAINDNGQIVADAYDTATNQGHALLLTPKLTIPPRSPDQQAGRLVPARTASRSRMTGWRHMGQAPRMTARTICSYRGSFGSYGHGQGQRCKTRLPAPPPVNSRQAAPGRNSRPSLPRLAARIGGGCSPRRSAPG